MDGCFDPIHFGHVKYIREARLAFPEWRTVVAVASDADIREKGREPFLGQMARCAVVDGMQGVDMVFAKSQPLHEVISALKPGALVKGKDWQGKLPPEVLTACALAGTQIVYLGDRLDSSTDRLRRWALADADASLTRLEAFMQAQTETPAARFDREYFAGDWRADGNTYTYEKRQEIEGKHPQLIAECFPKLSVLDVGCGPGYLVRMLKELGVDAGGCDPSPDAVAMAADRTVVQIDASDVPDKIADVVISREVCEHLTVNQIANMVSDLFRVARRFVYLTTRFAQQSVFDAATDFETDPTHITCLSQPFLRSLCVLNGGKRRKDLEIRLDHMGKGRCLVYEL